MLAMRKCSTGIDLAPESRADLSRLGFGNRELWLTTKPVHPWVRWCVPRKGRVLLDRLARGSVSETWVSADGTMLLEVEQLYQDLTWSQVTLLADGTLVRTSLHSERDEAALGRATTAMTYSGYDRAVVVRQTLSQLTQMHADRVARVSRQRRSAAVALEPDDYPSLGHRCVAVVQTATVMASAVLVTIQVLTMWGLGGVLALLALPVALGWVDLSFPLWVGALVGSGVPTVLGVLVSHRAMLALVPWMPVPRVPADRVLAAARPEGYEPLEA
jgi:hypothetical protein